MRNFLCILCISAFSLLPLSNVQAQGTIKFANTATSLVITNDFQGHIGAAASTYFHVALYWGVLGSTEAQLVQIGPGGPGSYPGIGGLDPALPGRFADLAGAYVTGTATPPSGTAVFEVKAWTGNYTTYDAARAAALGGDATVFLGSSGLFTSPTGGGTDGGVHPPDAAPLNLGANFTGIYLGMVPEPSTYALLGVGLLTFGLKRFWRKG